MGQKKEREERNSSFFFFSKISKQIFNWIFEFLLNFESNHSAQKLQCSSMYAQTCCYLMINFNLMKNFIFLYFHEHKNTELNYFSSISEEANFRVLHR